jgi:hypothetical protein
MRKHDLLYMLKINNISITENQLRRYVEYGFLTGERVGLQQSGVIACYPEDSLEIIKEIKTLRSEKYKLKRYHLYLVLEGIPCFLGKIKKTLVGILQRTN